MRARTLFTSALVLALGASGVTLAAPVSAQSRGAFFPSDSLQATRYEIVERAHVVDLRVDRGIATLVVQRTVANRGPKSDQATFFLQIPDGSVATRLRTAGVNGKGETVWFEGELMEAEAAAKKYQELTGIGGYYPKDPALLSWRHRGLLALQVFPVPAQSTKAVEYTLRMPLEYRDGAYHLELPPLGTEDVKATVRVSSAHAEDVVTVNGVAPAASGASSPGITADRALAVELRPHGVPRLDGQIASVPIADGKHLVRARIAAAPRLAEAPKGAHVVVLFDNSRSMQNAAGALAAVRAYLGHMKGAVVDFFAFDREVRSPIGRNVPVDAALSRLSSLELEPRNGSRLDDALAKADAILQTSPALARRVLVVTDTLMRSELGPEKIGASQWKSNAVMHVAVVESGAPSLARDDESPWSALPRRTGGLFWNAHASTLDAQARATFEEWARPKRIDKLWVRGITGSPALPDVLDEGQGIDHFTIASDATKRVDLTGELWSTPIATSFTPSGEQGKIAAALTFGSELYAQLSEPEQMKLAMLGGAVSPVTSYLAIEPGVRPSTEGLDWGLSGFGEGGGGRGEGIGLGTIGTLGHGGGVAKDKFLEEKLAAAARTCQLHAASSGGAPRAPGGRSVTVKLESTRIEIVDVGEVEVRPVRDAKGEACVREEMWKVMLPATFTSAFEAHAVTAKL